ncbi:hypothetical protein F4821DRAFT_274203 [Hypoxylon rubiginosum]|uniref:Uncharacterized protein n=1 Tax=Hypoxylon rubiginosum TaxID=110542 RepID=A0ACC0DLU7_9PEZI|nr:hypothetical protein F4821DRAFT_274203 [Hypoxylon rubiginosum]
MPASTGSAPAQYGLILDNFYTFLTNLHLPASAIKRPPEGGWPSYTSEVYKKSHKSAITMNVLRHLPYLEGGCDEGKHIHCKCHVVDYSTPSGALRPFTQMELSTEIQVLGGMHGAKIKNVVSFATACESDGRVILFDTNTGLIFEDSRGVRHTRCEPIEQYFNELKAKYEQLKLIPILGTASILDAEGVEDVPYEVPFPEMQPNTTFPSKKDVLWIRHIYRSHGWPNLKEFRKDAVRDGIKEYMEMRLQDKVDACR